MLRTDAQCCLSCLNKSLDVHRCSLYERQAQLLQNPMLYAYPFYSVVYNVGLVVVIGWLRWVGQGRLLGRLAFVSGLCVPAHVPDLQRWLVRVVMSLGLSVRLVKVLACV